QGFRSYNNVGFGYFRDFETMAKAISDNKLDKTSIIAYSFNSQNNLLKDITEETRGSYDAYFNKKREVKLTRQNIVKVPNTKNVTNLIDSKPSSIWSSNIPYSIPQTIGIDLGNTRKLVEVVIDPYNDLNQDTVGYAIYLSNDNKNWTKVFEQNNFNQ